VLSLIFFRATAIVYTFVANEILTAALNQVQSAFAQPENPRTARAISLHSRSNQPSTQQEQSAIGN
jgi:hypothetical protein